MKKHTSIVAIILFCLITVLLFLSPFKYNENTNNYELVQEIIIDRPVKQVFDYLGHSKHASEWSVFVDHITPLNPHWHQDGTVGSQRRCFKNKNEKGIFWDETILEVIPLQKRSLSVYNLNGFPISTTDLVTHQQYENIGDNMTKLKFGLIKPNKEVGILEWLKLKMAGYVVSSIFKKNLKGIKRQLER